jgi:hypothetical protein
MDTGDGVLLDRLLLINAKPTIAMVMVKATGKVSEIDQARRVTRIRRYLEDQWPSTALFAVTVGYSSAEIETLLGKTSSVLRFAEADFTNRLRMLTTETVASRNTETERPAQSDPALLRVLSNIADRLDRLEGERTKEATEIKEHFGAATAAISEPANLEREARTRWELMDTLDLVRLRLSKGDTYSERELMKSVLVGNEANLNKNKYFDYLGGLYLDMVSEEKSSGVKTDDLRHFRNEIITELMRLLRGPGLIDRLLEKPLAYWISVSWIPVLLADLVLRFSLSPGDFQVQYLPSLLARSGIMALPIGLASVLGFFFYNWMRKERWERRAHLLRMQEQDNKPRAKP